MTGIPMLYNDCWHGFWVRSWWPPMLWQTVTLWLVNRGWHWVGVGRSSRSINGRTPRDMRTMQSDLNSQSSQTRVSSQGYAANQRRKFRIWRYGLQRRCKRWHPLAPGRRYGARRSCPWCNGYSRRKWTRRHEIKSWTRLTAFHTALILLGKVWIRLFSLQLWVNSRTDWVLQPWWGN